MALEYVALAVLAVNIAMIIILATLLFKKRGGADLTHSGSPEGGERKGDPMKRMMMLDMIHDSHREDEVVKELLKEHAGHRSFLHDRDKMADEIKSEIKGDLKEVIRREIRKKMNS